MIDSFPEPATTADEAAASYAEHGLFWIKGALSSPELEALREAAAEPFAEVLRTLMVTRVLSEGAGKVPPPVRYAEVVERDGGRYDSRYG